MQCHVCGNEVKVGQKCTVCGYEAFELSESMPLPVLQTVKRDIKNKRAGYIGATKIYLQCYYWESINGELQEKSRENILLKDKMDETDLDVCYFGEIAFAKQTAGEEKEITIFVETKNEKKTFNVKVIAPDTEGLWKVGIIRKPGFKFVVRIGDSEKYVDSEQLSLI